MRSRQARIQQYLKWDQISTSFVMKRFKEKTLWRNFYAFDIQYKEKIMAI